MSVATYLAIMVVFWSFQVWAGRKLPFEYQFLFVGGSVVLAVVFWESRV